MSIAWQVRRVDETGSTNADLAERARAGGEEGEVLVAGHQTAGRGRLDRGWSSPPGAGLTFSVLLRPDPVPIARWSWLTHLVGLAVSDAAFAVGAGVSAALKWPNDVLIDGRKVCGILGQVVPGRPAALESGRSAAVEEPRRPAAVVIGVGLNAASTPDVLPPTGTSLSIAACRRIAPDEVLEPILAELSRWYGRWRAAGGDAEAAGIRAAYRERSATLGREVAIEASGEWVSGTAADVDRDGRLVIRTADGDRTFGSGDVTHAALR